MQILYGTDELDLVLSNNTKAICIDNTQFEVFKSQRGLYQIDDSGLSVDFFAKPYAHLKWIIIKNDNARKNARNS